ncbi:MAG: M16 family metallopeptidase [Candidatus Acidiferrales bacterium]
MKHTWKNLALTFLLLGSLAGPAALAQDVGQAKGTGIVPPGVQLGAQMPNGAPPGPYHFPAVASKTLANGLRVFVATDPREPAVATRLVLLSAGAIRDPQGFSGAARLTSSLLTQGTEKRSAKDIAEAIDFVGGSLDANSDSDATYVTLNVVKRDIGLGLDLMSDVVLHPAFREEEIDRERQKLLSLFQASYANPQFLASAGFERVVFGSSPYGLPANGTPESVRKLNHDALVQFHNANYAPNQALLAFAGDITPEEAFAMAEKYFGSWPKQDAPTAEPAPPPATKGVHILVIDKPDAVQTQIRVGRLGIQRNDPNYIPLFVTNRIFGGGFNSRLNTEVRVRKGLTYGANSSFASERFAGDFVAQTFTKTETTVEATKLVVDLISRMGTGDVTPEEMSFAKEYLAGVYPIQTETGEQVADRVIAVEEFGLPSDYNSTYQQKILQVTSDQVKDVAGKYFDAKSLDIVLAGNASAFRDDLKKAFPSASYDEIPASELDLLAAEMRRTKSPAVAAATPESLAKGKALLQAAAQAAGGPALQGIESLEESASGTARFQGQEFPLDIHIQIAYPDRMLVETKLPFGSVRQGFDGKAGWLAAPQGIMDAPPQLIGEFQRSIVLTGGLGLYQQALAGKIEAQYLGEEQIDGKAASAVLWKAESGPVKLYFDPSTHLLVAAHFTSPTMQGGTAETDQHWSDFRAVNGVQFPFHSVIFRDGEKYSDTTIKDMKPNSKPDPSIFAKPQQ